MAKKDKKPTEDKKVVTEGAAGADKNKSESSKGKGGEAAAKKGVDWAASLRWGLLPMMIMGNVLQFLTIYLLIYADLGKTDAPSELTLPLPPVRARTEFYVQDTVFFEAKDGNRLEAFQYLPTEKARPASLGLPPVVVMAHGMGAQKDMKLPEYATKFARAGFAVVLFDYRTFGGSEGLPRHHLRPWNHVEDYESALQYVATSPQLDGKVDRERVGLWGTSFSGGHVLVAGSGEHAQSVRAIVSQVPYLDPDVSGSRLGFVDKIRFGFIGSRDYFARFLGYNRTYYPLYPNEPDTPSVLNVDGEDAWKELKQGKFRGHWENKVTASIFADIVFYKPRTYAEGVKAPVLLIASVKDQLCPVDAVRPILETLPNKASKLVEFDDTHFGIYMNDTFEKAVSEMIEFYKLHLESSK